MQMLRAKVEQEREARLLAQKQLQARRGTDPNPKPELNPKPNPEPNPATLAPGDTRHGP